MTNYFLQRLIICVTYMSVVLCSQYGKGDVFSWNVQKYQIMIVPNSRLKFRAFPWYSSVFRGSDSLPRGRSKVEVDFLREEEKFQKTYVKSDQTDRSELYTTFSGKFYKDLEEIFQTQKEH